MEAAEPIQLTTPKPSLDNIKIDFIEELRIKKEKGDYKIQYGIKGDALVIKVSSENSENIFYYQGIYTIIELQNISKIFSMYETPKDIISFLKDLKYDIEEKNNDLIVKFNIFMPNGTSKLIEFNLKKCLPDNNQMINYLLEKIKSIETNNKNERIRQENEIKDLNEKVSKYINESSKLKENIMNYKNEITYLKDENKKLWEEINNLKKFIEKPQNKSFDSKIIGSINTIDFILNYIRQNDKSFNFNEIKLLYRGSRDGDSTKTCHELCDNKRNVLIVMKSETDYMFGGYSKIGFKTSEWDKKVDDNSFLFSINLKKIYPAIKGQKVISHAPESAGLCFYGSLAFYDKFMNQNNWNSYSESSKYFNGLDHKYEINGGNYNFKFKEIEVFQLL